MNPLIRGRHVCSMQSAHTRYNNACSRFPCCSSEDGPAQNTSLLPPAVCRLHRAARQHTTPHRFVKIIEDKQTQPASIMRGVCVNIRVDPNPAGGERNASPRVRSDGQTKTFKQKGSHFFPALIMTGREQEKLVTHSRPHPLQIGVFRLRVNSVRPTVFTFSRKHPVTRTWSLHDVLAMNTLHTHAKEGP